MMTTPEFYTCTKTLGTLRRTNISQHSFIFWSVKHQKAFLKCFLFSEAGSFFITKK